MITAGGRLGGFTAVASQMSAVEHEEDEQYTERGKLSRATSAAEAGSFSEATKEKENCAPWSSQWKLAVGGK